MEHRAIISAEMAHMAMTLGMIVGGPAYCHEVYCVEPKDAKAFDDLCRERGLEPPTWSPPL